MSHGRFGVGIIRQYRDAVVLHPFAAAQEKQMRDICAREWDQNLAFGKSKPQCKRRNQYTTRSSFSVSVIR